MSFVSASDGTQIFFKDWGTGQPVVFSHGWPLTADDWDRQMLFLLDQGFRVIAHDRRGHGRSGQTAHGNDMDTYSDDLAALTAALDLKDAVHIGHSTGGGEVARYIGRHGTARVAKAVLLSAVPPIMVASDTNPDGVPIAVFDGIRAGMVANRSQAYLDITMPFYGFNRDGVDLVEGTRQSFWLQSMMGGVKPHYDCIKAFSETDFTEDLKRFDVPTLIAHGDDDQIVPIHNAALKSAKLVPGATLKIFPGLPHGLAATHPDILNAALLEFITV